MLPTRRFSFGPWLIALTFLSLSSSSNAQSTVWGLQRRDAFRVQTTIERQTTLQTDETTESTTNVTDIFTLEYQVQRVLPDSAAVIQVRVIRAERKVDGEVDKKHGSQLALLSNLSVVVVVDPTGVVRTVSGHTNELNRALEAHQSSRELIGECITESVFRSWISHPFWVTGPPQEAEKSDPWERVHKLSLGPLGSMQTIATCAAGETEDGITNVVISGDTRYVPANGDDRNAGGTIQFSNGSAKMESFSGTGQFAAPIEPLDDLAEETEPETDVEPPEKRPLFENLSLAFSYSGTATITLAGMERRLKFRQQQKHSSKLLPGHRIGRLFNFQP